MLRQPSSKAGVLNQFIAKGWKLFGTVDTLINVAGGSLPGRPTHLLEVTEERCDMIMDLNAKSTFFCQEFIRTHLEHGTVGSIVNFASQAGIVPNEYARPHYAAAKGAVVFLASDDASYITGEILNCCGGGF